MRRLQGSLSAAVLLLGVTLACDPSATPGGPQEGPALDEPTVSLEDIDRDGIRDGRDEDMDGDGIPNTEDDDIDGDGTANAEDETPRGEATDRTGPEGDIDHDGLPNIDDDDDDGDGVLDGVIGVGDCDGDVAADEASDCDGFCAGAEFGYLPCEDGAPEGSGRDDDDGDPLTPPGGDLSGEPETEPEPELDPRDPGLQCGHIDVDTSSEVYALNDGTTDGHVHEYDDEYNVTGFDAFASRNSALDEIGQHITDPTQKFKIIVGNADLSPGARLVINHTYDGSDRTTFVPATRYAEIPVGQLPIFSLGGVAGTLPLAALAVHFRVRGIDDRQVHPTVTGDVRNNTPGAQGEARNGALIVQAVAVDDDGSDAFSTDRSLSNGGVHGVATEGLLYEITVFWHWKGPSYDDARWATYDPSGDLTCND